jgi:hypothetical protein
MYISLTGRTRLRAATAWPASWKYVKYHQIGYLNAFTTASVRTRRTLYLDLFAGAPDNFARGTGEVILGSGHRALAADPPFTRVVPCELQPKLLRVWRRR